MRTARFFVPPDWIAFQSKAFSIPAGPMYRQMVTVLRLKAGSIIGLCPNDNSELECTITEITKSAILGTIGEVRVGEVLRPTVTLCAAITKRDTFEWTLQKCTELGVSTIIPIITDRVIKKTKDIPTRWLDITREASEQSGRTLLPVIMEPMSLSSALEHTKKDVRIALHEAVDGPSTLPTTRLMDHVALFVGPEGGFSPQEITTFSSANIPVIQLGNLVLRAETATAVAVAMLRFTAKN